MVARNLLARLKGGDRRSLGRADEIAAEVTKNPRKFPQLIAGLWSDDALVRMRAADATEKVTRVHPALLQRYKKELLGLMAETEQIEVKWHLAAMVTRLRLAAEERRRLLAMLHGYLEDRSAIVRVFALQALADLTQRDARLRDGVIELLREAAHGGAAVRARARKLLRDFV
jgi:HEAT repeat protein